MKCFKAFISYRFKRTTLILLALIALMGGIGLGKYHFRYSLVVVLLFALLGLAFCRKRNILFIVCVCICCFLVGHMRGAHYATNIDKFTPHYYKKITVNLTASEDAVYGKTKQLSFAAKDIYLENGDHLVGKIQVSGFGVNSIYEGDQLEVTGKLYPGYSAYQGRISFAVLKINSRHSSLISEFRRKFSSGISSALPEPLAPFAMGILVGQRASLPESIKKDLLMVGLTHIIAVSGYNLTIILQACKKLLGGMSKRISTFIALALIAVFLAIAGASASIVRAAIVSVLSVCAGYYGRSIKPLLLILMAAGITAWANPVYVWSDISWYLSFLAFFGVLVLAPLIKTRLQINLFETLIGSIALESLCAEIMSLPYVVHMFGQMSLVGLIANVLVVSLVPLAMLLSMIAGIAGMIYAVGSGFFAWPAIILLNAMLDTSHLLANIHGVFVEGIELSLYMMICMYFLIGFLAIVLTSKTKHQQHGKITDRKESKYAGIIA